jgi:hypothetical protein
VLLEALLKHYGVEPPALPALPDTEQGFTTEEPLPKALGPKEMAQAFGMSTANFRRLQKLGEFRPFELPRPIGIKRYSAVKVQTFLRGRK